MRSQRPFVPGPLRGERGRVPGPASARQDPAQGESTAAFHSLPERPVSLGQLLPVSWHRAQPPVGSQGLGTHLPCFLSRRRGKCSRAPAALCRASSAASGAGGIRKIQRGRAPLPGYSARLQREGGDGAFLSCPLPGRRGLSCWYQCLLKVSGKTVSGKSSMFNQNDFS